MLDAKDVDNAAYGKWVGIYSSLGIDVGTRGAHCACPLCGPGENSHRFRMDGGATNGSWICTQCGAGTGLSMVGKYFNIPFPEVLEKVAAVVGHCESCEPEPPKPDPSIALNRLWQSSTQLTGEDPVSKYLNGRGLLFHPNALRSCSSCYNTETETRHNAMLAKIVDPEGRPVTIHRTYLSPDGEKADVPKAKKLMPGVRNASGGAIRLFPVNGDLVGVAEGIETAISCRQLFDIPTWATTGTSLLEAFIPPDGVRRVSIFADRDANFAGEKSAYILANKLYLKDYIVEVVVPDEIGDFNDVLVRDREQLTPTKEVPQ